jgi:hypothetical protein
LIQIAPLSLINIGSLSYAPVQVLYDLVEELRAPEKVNHFVRSRAGSTSLLLMATRANPYLQKGSPLYESFVDTLALHMQNLKGSYLLPMRLFPII